MKKIFSTLCMALIAVAMMGQDPVITFNEMEHDFGKINEADGKVTTVFTFKNEGMTPLIINDAKASCGCTKPVFTEEPVEPGQTGTITVSFNPNGYGGKHFKKTITVSSNAKTPTVTLKIFGDVIAKQAKPENKYAIPVGELSMSTKVLDLGIIKKGQVKGGELEYANLTKEEHKVELATNASENYLINEVTLPTVKASEVGKFILILDSKKTKLYGPVEAKAYVVVDGKKTLTDEYRILLKANIVEDFDAMTAEDKQNSPILEVSRNVNLGKIAAGKTLRGRVEVLNVGVNPLEIHRVYCFDPSITIKSAKSIKSGKKGVISVDINTTGLEPGAYSREITIYSNDYKRSIQRVLLNFTIE